MLPTPILLLTITMPPSGWSAKVAAVNLAFSGLRSKLLYSRRMRKISDALQSIVQTRMASRNRHLTTLCLTSSLILAGGTLLGQPAVELGEMDLTGGADEAGDSSAPDIIFSNVDRAPGARFNIDSFFAKPIAGKQASDQTEELYAVWFTPKTDVQAKVLEASIAHLSGAKLVKLGLYSNDEIFQTVGDPLPGGQGTTTRIPDADECCKLAKVTLAGDGITLTAGTRYWLVAGADDVNGASFSGLWRLSNVGDSAYFEPSFPWNPQPSNWPAAQIRGTRLQTSTSEKAVSPGSVSTEATGSGQKVTIFSNLDRIGSFLYVTGPGPIVAGKDATAFSEVWEALPFSPRISAHATTLSAAIGYYAGTKRVDLAIYNDNAGVPGSLLPNGQGSTTDIPYYTDCCQLAVVTLPQNGVALSVGTQYWLVASPDVEASDFEAFWRLSILAIIGNQEPEHSTSWTTLTGEWFAAEILGTNP